MQKLLIAALLSSGFVATAMATTWEAQYFEEIAKAGTAKTVAYLPPLGGVRVERSRVTTAEGKTYTVSGTFPGVEGTALTVERLRKGTDRPQLCGGVPKTCLILE